MPASLSSLGDNQTENIYNDGICFNCSSSLEYISTKNDKLLLECFDGKKRYSRKFSKKLTKKIKNAWRFCNEDVDKFMLLLRKGVYPYEYMGDWSRFNEEELPGKSDIYSSLNMEEITLIIDKLKKFLISFVLKIWVIIMIFMF